MLSFFLFFFFNDTATTEIYPLSLHDALPIFAGKPAIAENTLLDFRIPLRLPMIDRKSTRLNSSHLVISYAVFCLKKKNELIPEIHWEFSQVPKASYQIHRTVN